MIDIPLRFETNLYRVIYRTSDLSIVRFESGMFQKINDGEERLPIDRATFDFFSENPRAKIIRRDNDVELDLCSEFEFQAAQIREKRDQLLMSFEFTLFPDSPAGSAVREDILRCRQVLYDISSQPGFPHDVNWPDRRVFE